MAFMNKLLKNKTFTRNALTYLLVTVVFIIMYAQQMAGSLTYAMQGQLVPICVYISLAVSLNLLVGICGELSLGHAGFMGVGAFTGIILSALLKPYVADPTLRLVLAMLGGGLMAGGFSAVIGIPVLRLHGDYLAIVTLAFGEILRNLLGNLYVASGDGTFRFAISAEQVEWTETMIINGAKGAVRVEKLATFPMGFALVMVTLFVVLNLINSKEGRAIRAVRDNRIAAESVGINVTAFRMKAFIVSALLAGMAGALFGLNYSSLKASKFDFNTSIDILVFVVLGGLGNILGSVISATVLYILPEAMKMLANENMTPALLAAAEFVEKYRMILYSVILIVLMICTWSPKVKNALSAFFVPIKEKVSGLFRKKNKEVAGDE